MPGLSEVKGNELEAFWRKHFQGWCDSSLNQREYCEAHRLSLKRFRNWRAKLRGEVPLVAGKLPYRHGGAANVSASAGTRQAPRADLIPFSRAKSSGMFGWRLTCRD